MEERTRGSGGQADGHPRPSRILVQRVAGPAGRRSVETEKRCGDKLGVVGQPKAGRRGADPLFRHTLAQSKKWYGNRDYKLRGTRPLKCPACQLCICGNDNPYRIHLRAIFSWHQKWRVFLILSLKNSPDRPPPPPHPTFLFFSLLLLLFF